MYYSIIPYNKYKKILKYMNIYLLPDINLKINSSVSSYIINRECNLCFLYTLIKFDILISFINNIDYNS